MKNLRTGIVLEDQSSEALTLEKSISDAKPWFQADVTRNKPKVMNGVQNGRYKGLVDIPFYFTRYLLNHYKTAPVQVIADGSEPNTANFVQNYTLGAYDKWQTIRHLENATAFNNPITAEPRFWYNEELDSSNFLIPGSIAIIMTLIGTLLTALVMAREWERGTIEALMATPVKMIEILGSKILAYFTLGIGSMFLCTFVAVVIYHVPFRGSYFALFLVSSAFLCAALGTGLLTSTLAKNQFVASQVSIITAFLPAFMLSGFIFEITSMPLPIRLLTYLFPARYMVTCLQTLFMVGNVWSLLIHNSLVMLAFGLFFFTIIQCITVKRLD
jgi:ABC-2 type transport system permease protein